MFKKLFIAILFLSLTQCMQSSFQDMPSQVGVADSTGTPIQNVILGVGTGKRVQMWTYDSLGNSLGPASSNSMIQGQLTQTSNPQVAAPYAALPGCIFAHQISNQPIIVQVSGNTLNHGQLVGQALLSVDHSSVIQPGVLQTDVVVGKALESATIQSSQGGLLGFAGINNNNEVRFFRVDDVRQTSSSNAFLLFDQQWSSLANLQRPQITATPPDPNFSPQYRALGLAGIDNSNLFAVSYEYISYPSNPPTLQTGQKIIDTPTYVGLSLYDSHAGSMVSKKSKLPWPYWNSTPARATPALAQERYFNVEKTQSVYLKKNSHVIMVGYGKALPSPQVTAPAQQTTYYFFGTSAVPANLNQFDQLTQLFLGTPGVSSLTLNVQTDLNFKIISNDEGHVRLFFISEQGQDLKVISTFYSATTGWGGSEPKVQNDPLDSGALLYHEKGYGVGARGDAFGLAYIRDNKLYFRLSRGTAWSKEIEITKNYFAQAQFDKEPVVQFSEDGDVYILWEDVSGSFHLSSSFDGALSWQHLNLSNFMGSGASHVNIHAYSCQTALISYADSSGYQAQIINPFNRQQVTNLNSSTQTLPYHFTISNTVPEKIYRAPYDTLSNQARFIFSTTGTGNTHSVYYTYY